MEETKRETAVPEYGIKLKLDHKYPEKWTQKAKIRILQIIPLIPLVFRYIIYYLKLLWQGRKPIMDYIHVLTGKQIYGVPLGGIGGGTIGRGYRGEFCRYQLKPGLYEYNTVHANQFIITIKNGLQETIFQSLLSTYKKPSKVLKHWKSLIDGSKCTYTGLYPRSWTEYDLSEHGIKLTCRQISPVIPHNYKDSSLPCGVFVWDVENVCDEERIVTIAFTFKNGTGDKKQDTAAPCWSKSFTYEETEGMILHHVIKNMPCTYALSIKNSNDLSISKCLSFDPNSNGEIPWNQLLKNGKFDKVSDLKASHECDEMGVAVAAQVIIGATNANKIEMALVWDMPVVNFTKKIRKHKRFYTKYFGAENAAAKIAEYALNNYKVWDTEIHNWQSKVLDDDDLPDWYKSALFNELYFVSDGGSVWFTADDGDVLSQSDPRMEYGRFAFLEGHEYRMYNTYDVHFYASHALVMNWPLLQVCLQYDMKDAIFTEIPKTRTSLYDGKVVKIKAMYTVPHDVGDPDEEPFLMLNSYNIHDVSEWRDLNLKFVLQVFRDYRFMDSKAGVGGVDSKLYLRNMFSACKKAMQKSSEFDRDFDGLIENSGSPDQTYDTWVMTGPSAYCGGLWLAALHCMVAMCDVLGQPDERLLYEKIRDKGKESLERTLWNGRFYMFDVKNPKTIMSDQLCGHWYLRCCGFDHEIYPKANVDSALRTVFQNNVDKFGKCQFGAVNGFTSDGQVDKTTIQSEEVWVGVTYALASTMLFEGMLDEAWLTAGGMFKHLTETIGMAYETPEALNIRKWYRAIGYMRPLSIWSMQLAWEHRPSR